MCTSHGSGVGKKEFGRKLVWHRLAPTDGLLWKNDPQRWLERVLFVGSRRLGRCLKGFFGRCNFIAWLPVTGFLSVPKIWCVRSSPPLEGIYYIGRASKIKEN
jgi:hypothetical protein